ncbi:MAG: S8/S53 family peptidase, partial [Myxococcaceae bacterium]
MSTISGVLDNGYGGAGTAAPVADVVAIPSPSPDVFQYVGYALKVIQALVGGPQIINISATTSVPGPLGFTVKPLDNIITLLRGKTFGPVQIRFGPGALVFAAAGNDGADVDNESCFGVCWETDVIMPCELDDVVCVGGLKYGSRFADPGSNWGRKQRRHGNGSDSADSQDNSVDLYAPFTVIVGPDGDGAGNLQGSAGRFDSGTSFSSPFAAGIAALVWAADPTLNADEVFAILLKTADSTPGGDGLVINALAAVKSALSTQNNPPAVRITAPTAATTTVVGFPGVTFSAEAKDLEDGNTCCQISWSSDVEGTLGTGVSLTHQFQTLGAQIITATAKDSQGATSHAQIHVTVKDTPPLVSIINPGAGDTIYRARPVNVLGRALESLSDLCQPPYPASNISWSSSDASDGFIGLGCGQVYIAGSTGTRTLTFTARNQFGTTASASIIIDVQATPPGPTISITSPVTGASAQAGSVVSLAALPSGGVAPLTYRWTWTSSNTGCAEQTITVTPQTATPPYIAASWDTSKLPPNGCSAGIGILKVYATDSLNQVGASPGVSFDLFVIN